MGESIAISVCIKCIYTNLRLLPYGHTVLMHCNIDRTEANMNDPCMAKTKTDDEGRAPNLTVPAPQELLDAVDEYAKWLSSQRLGMRVTRAQAVREILVEFLSAWRAKQKPAA